MKDGSLTKGIDNIKKSQMGVLELKNMITTKTKNLSDELHNRMLRAEKVQVN